MSKAKPTSAIDLAGIFSAAQQAIALVAPDAAILFANQAFFELCSAKPRPDDDEEFDALPEWCRQLEVGELIRSARQGKLTIDRLIGATADSRRWYRCITQPISATGAANTQPAESPASATQSLASVDPHALWLIHVNSIPAPTAAVESTDRLTELGRWHDEQLVRLGNASLPASSAAIMRVISQVELAVSSKQASVLIVGPAGSGKLTLARLIDARKRPRKGKLRQIDAEVMDEGEIARALLGEMLPVARWPKNPPTQLDGVVIIRQVDQLSQLVKQQLAAWLRDPARRFQLLATATEDPAAGEPEFPDVEPASNNLGNQADFLSLSAPDFSAAKATESASPTSAKVPADQSATRVNQDFRSAIETLTINLPPLCDRPDDLPKWIDLFTQEYLAGKSEPKPVLLFEPTALKLLVEYRWPGNLRELKTVLFEVFDRHTSDDFIQATALPSRISQHKLPLATSPVESATSIKLDDVLQQVEQRLLSLAERLAGGNKTKAAQLLGLTRSAYTKRLNK